MRPATILSFRFGLLLLIAALALACSNKEESASGEGGGGGTATSAQGAAEVDLERVHYQFASCDFSGKGLSAFEEAINEDDALFTTSGSDGAQTAGASSKTESGYTIARSESYESESKTTTTNTTTTRRGTDEPIQVVEADDGSLIGWIDRNKDGTLNSNYSLREISTLETASAPDSEEVVFRIHYDVNDRTIIYSDRRHKHLKTSVDEMQDVEVDVTNSMAKKQHTYYDGYWETPGNWVYVKRTHVINNTRTINNNTTVRENSVTRNRTSKGGGPGQGK